QLKVSSGQDLSQLLTMAPDQLKRQEIERRIITHTNGLQLFMAPQIGNDNPMTPGHAEQFLDAFTARAQFVILDLPAVPDESTRRIFELSDQILLVTEPEALSISCAYLQIRNLREWDVFDRVNLVISTRTPSASWFNRVEVENRLGMGGGEAREASRWEPRALEVDVRMRQGVAGVIPSAPELFHESVRAGVPIILIEPSAPAARALLDLADWLADKQPEDHQITEKPVRYVS
ncbi:MAG: hypothetical protein WAM60_11280, partial [Candidatus Promineifilaceae bacterium]